MDFYHDKEEALKQHSTELRIIALKDGTERAIRLEKYIWDEYDFMTGRVYGYAYNSDEQMFDWAERSAAEIGKPFDYALDQIIRLATYVLKGKIFPNKTVIS